MAEEAKWYVKTDDGSVYGPATVSTLISWAQTGQVLPLHELYSDRRHWIPAPEMKELEMKWMIELEPGKIFGPFNRALVIQVFKDGSAPAGSKAYRLHEYPIDQDPPPKVVVKVVEKVVEKEKPSFWSIFKKKPAEKKSIFSGMDRTKLLALEAAAQREIMRSRQMKADYQKRLAYSGKSDTVVGRSV